MRLFSIKSCLQVTQLNAGNDTLQQSQCQGDVRTLAACQASSTTAWRPGRPRTVVVGLRVRGGEKQTERLQMSQSTLIAKYRANPF
jgi:hypothetical protein